MLTCDTVSGSLEGCPDIKVTYHQTPELKSCVFLSDFDCLGLAWKNLQEYCIFGILEHLSSWFL